MLNKKAFLQSFQIALRNVHLFLPQNEYLLNMCLVFTANFYVLYYTCIQYVKALVTFEKKITQPGEL